MMRAPAIMLVVVGAFWPTLSVFASPPSQNGYEVLGLMLSSSRQERDAAARLLIERADPSMVPGLVDAIFFTPKESRAQVLNTLEALTGEQRRDYYSWVEFVGAHAEIEPAAGYLQWKRSLLTRIDQDYAVVLYDGAPTRIRLEEVVWGGVPMAGIPALDDPPTMPGSKARYLRGKEKVFGIVVNGEARAYPLRFLSWHEMLNDSLGGEPITLSFCTLCGSGIFYATRTPNREAYRFDTSGLLYRSNKLMVDRRSRTLWSNLTGEPVIGRLARSPIQLEMLPGTLSTWQAWLRQHPRTTVLDLEGIEGQMRPRYSYEYRPGAAALHRRDVEFPVWLSSDRLDRDQEVFALRLASQAKAYPTDRVIRAGVVNDEVGGEPVVLIGDPESGAVRAYRRASHRFQVAENGQLEDGKGSPWRIEEAGLRPLKPDGEQKFLERLPGHVALWFGWYAFYPQTRVWQN